MRLLHQIFMEKTARSASGGGAKALCVEAIRICGDSRPVFAISTSSLSITFWDASTYQLGDENAPRYMHSVYTAKPQLVLAWSYRAQLLFTSGSDSDILVFSFCVNSQSDFETKQVAVLKRHDDIIKDLLCVDEHLVLASGSLDGKLLVWDLPLFPQIAEEEDIEETSRDAYRATWPVVVYRGERKGHKRGIRSLDYCGNGVILSSSFDMTSHGWDVSGLSDKSLFCLRGHTSPLIGGKALNDGNYVVTLDANGIFKVWDARIESNIMDIDRCVQTFTTEAATRLDHTVQTFSPCAMTLVRKSNVVVAASKKMHVWDRVPIAVQEHSAAACVYNDKSMSVIAAVHRDVKIWNALTGELEHFFQDVTSSDICALSLDFRQRKFILGDQNGEVSVFNYLNGSKMKSNEAAVGEMPRSISQSREISCMLYCNEDKVIITSGWDKVIRVYDELDPDDVEMLRSIHKAHESDINAMAHSRTLNLIATGDECGNISIWDFQFFTHEATCKDVRTGVRGAGITALCFFADYPLLVSGDAEGKIKFWLVRPWMRDLSAADGLYLERNECVLCCDNAPGGASAIKTMHLSTARSGFHLYVGTESGHISVFDTKPLIDELKLSPVLCEQSPTSKGNYNPRRRIKRTHVTEDADIAGGDLEKPSLDFSLAASGSWKAHTNQINTMNFIPENNRMITCALDKSIKMWNLDTLALEGSLASTEIPGDETAWRNKKWKMNIDVDSRKQEELLRGRKVLRDILGIEEKQLQDADDSFEGQICYDRGDRRGLSIAIQRSEHRRETVSGISARASAANGANSFQRTIPTADEIKQYAERRRVMGQLGGKKTWVMSQAELAHEKIVGREKRKHRKKLRKLRRKAKKNKSDPLAELLSDEPSGRKLPALNVPPIKLELNDPENWAMGSRNREEQMYANHFREMERLALQNSKSDERVKAATRPSEFLMKQLGIANETARISPSRSEPALKLRAGKAKDRKKKRSKKKTKKASTPSPQMAIQDTFEFDFNITAPTSQTPHRARHATRMLTRSPVNKLVVSVGADDGGFGTEGSSSRLRVDEEKTRIQKQEAARKDAEMERANRLASRERKEALRAAHAALNEASNAQLVTHIDEVSQEELRRLETIKRFGPYSRKEVEHFRRVFHRMDVNQNGVVSKEEFVLGLKSSHFEDREAHDTVVDNALAMFSAIDADRSGSFDIAEFAQEIFTSATKSQMQDIISVLKINPFKLKEAAKVAESGTDAPAATGAPKSRKRRITVNPRKLAELRQLFNIYDADGSGGIDAKELYSALCVTGTLGAQSKIEHKTTGAGLGRRAKLEEEDIEYIFRAVDLDEDQQLNFEEFCHLFHEWT